MSDTEAVAIVKRWWRFFRPGPPIVLLLFAQASTGTVLADLIVYRTCLFSLNGSFTKCSILHANASSTEAQELEAEMDPGASMIIMVKSLIESILPALLSLFLGPWSDRGGRRPLLLASVTGFTLMYTMLTLMCNWNISPWYLVIPSLLTAMLGGLAAIMFASICYISDTAEEKDRVMLLAWIQASISAGFLLGVFIGPVIYKNYGFTVVFATAAFGCTLALLYTYFCIPESVKDASKESIWSLFEFSSVKELVASSLRKRNGFDRAVVWLGTFVVTVWVLITQGEATIEYLFTRERLGWDVQCYAYITGFSIVISMTGVLGGISLFSRILELSDSVVAGIGLISGLACAITKSLISEDWHMYLAVCIGMFTGIMGPVNRSIISKSVPPEDLGKIFSLTVSLETLSPLAGAPLYTLIYSHYLPPIYPSPVYLVSASLFIILLIIVAWTGVLINKSRDPDYTSLLPHN